MKMSGLKCESFNVRDNTFMELYAGAILNEIKFFSEDFTIDCKLEKPDLQVGDIGIEVTVDFPESIGQRRSIINKIHDLPFSGQCEQLDTNPHCKNHKDILSGDANNYNYHLELVNRDEHYNRIVNAIERKEEKYPLYKKFNIMGLFISASFYYDSIRLQEKLEKIKSSYNVIFIMALDGVLYRWENFSLICYDICDKQLELSKQTHILRKQYFQKYGK